MNLPKLAAVAGLILAMAWSPASADAQTADDGGLWMSFNGNGAGREVGLQHPKLKWWFDGHLRFLDDAEGFNQSIVRPGIGWDLGNDAALWAGYGWIHNAPVGGGDFDEHRLWQQYTWAPKCDDWSYLFRSRFEQRWLDRGNDTGLRFRQMFRASKQLAHHPRITAVVWDEMFIHLNDTDWGARAGFDQNRVFAGFGFKRCTTDRLRTEIGYLNQAINRPGSANRVNHILSINFFY